ncbi:MAG: DUF3108 domain-containing protein [Gammaproteobacteria bacterium]
MKPRTAIARFASLLTAAAVLLPAALPAADSQLMPDFAAHYTAYKGSFRIATSTVHLTRNGDRYTYASFTEPAGILALFRSDTVTESSVLEYRNGRILPLHYRYLLDGRKRKDVRLEFHWDRNQVTNTVKGRSWTMHVPDGALDKFSVQLAVMRDLADGRTKLDYDIADGGKLKNYRFKILGTEQITTRAGTFNTVKLMRIRENKKRKTYMWAAPKLDYLLIRIQHIETNGSRFHMDLDQVGGPLKRQAAARGVDLARGD